MSHLHPHTLTACAYVRTVCAACGCMRAWPDNSPRDHASHRQTAAWHDAPGMCHGAVHPTSKLRMSA